MELISPTAHACVKLAKPRLLRVTGTLLIALFVFLTISAMSPLQADAGQATLAWDTDTSPSVAGYMLHYGTAPGNYSQSIDVGNVTSYTVASLTDGQTYYFAAMAYDSAGQQSGYSNEVSKTVSSTTPATYSITATASGYGSITALNNSNISTSSSGSSIVTTVTVSSGASQTFSITPSSGYQVASVTVDGRSVGAVTTYTFSNVTAAHTISATFTANTASGFSITATAGSNGTITPSGSTSVSSGASQPYTITPNTGYYVVSVVVDGTTVASNLPSGGYTYTFSNVTANHTISATFAIRYFHITASAGTGGSVSPADVWNLYNTSQAITITPNSGYKIANVTVDGTSVGAVSSYTLSNIAANHTVSATFAANTATSSYTITASAGANGTISPLGSSTVSSGTSKSYTITPNAGYKVASVTVDGVSVGAVSTYTFSNVTANHAISATFAANTTSSYTITASAGSNGTISPAGSTAVSSGTSRSYTITPNTGYYVVSVVVDGTTVASNIPSGGYTYTFSNVTANHTISATFAIRYFHITAIAGSGGSVSPTDTWVLYNTSPSVTITPNSGYRIANVTVDGTSVGAVSTYTFNNIAVNHTVQATFQ